MDTGKKPYECEKRGKAFERHSCLAVPEGHTKESPNKCRVWAGAFTPSSQFPGYQRLYSEGKLYAVENVRKPLT